MLRICLFTIEEDEYLKEKVRVVPVSRIAIRLNRSYSCIEARMLELNLIKSEDMVCDKKFMTSDEEDYQMLRSGFTEDEIKKYRGCRLVLPSKEFTCL